MKVIVLRSANQNRGDTLPITPYLFDEETSQYQLINQEATPNSELGRNILKGA